MRATGRAPWVRAWSARPPTPLGAAPSRWPSAEPSERTAALASELRATVRALLERPGGRRLAEVLRGVDDPGALADAAGWWPELSFDRKVELLETIDVDGVSRRSSAGPRRRWPSCELTERIRHDVTEGIEKNQREFLLRQQMAAIRKELGEDGDDEDVAERLPRPARPSCATAVPDARPP